MDASYDEDVTLNPFFGSLMRWRDGRLAGECSSRGWIVCVPRVGAAKGVGCSDAELAAHVLAPTDRRTRLLVALTGAEVRRDGDTLSGADGVTATVLFEQTFYASGGVKYKVWCLDAPLNATAQCDDTLFTALRTVEDCVEFLWTEAEGGRPLEEIDALIDDFNRSRRGFGDTLDSLRSDSHDLYSRCSDVVLRCKKVKAKTEASGFYSRRLTLAIETYVLRGVHDSLFRALSSCTARRDATFNKTLRNLAELQPSDLGIDCGFLRCIPEAKTRLAEIKKRKTALGKLNCIRNAMASVRRTLNSTSAPLSADDLLPVMVFLVVKSGLNNWHAQLRFVMDFHVDVDSHRDYAISTLEAVLKYIETNLSVTHVRRISRSSDSGLEHLFDLVKTSQYDSIKKILNIKRNDLGQNGVKKIDSIDEVLEDDLHVLCHPLCTCSKCIRISHDETSCTIPTVHSRNPHGRTVLHIASTYGDPQVVILLLNLGADVHEVDFDGFTPLHYAASNGRQTALLLLLHAGADPEATNTDGNTPLHIAANNGHDSCVKALMYFNNRKISVDRENKDGDTPLHLASKWGYETIAYALLECGADPKKPNSMGKSPIDCSHSDLMLKLLCSHDQYLNGFVNVVNMQENIAIVVDANEHSLVSLNSPKNKIGINRKNSSSSPVKPCTTVGIHHLERVFKAISYGDAKLACFYMNLDPARPRINSTVSSNLCHPLCSCPECEASEVRRKPQTESNQFDVDTSDLYGDTPLHIAARHGQSDIARLLLANGAWSNYQNKNGSTPLHIAAQRGRSQIVEALLEAGTNVDTRDGSGNTALHLACAVGNAKIVRSLLERSCDVYATNNACKTALDEAKDRTFIGIITLFDKSARKKNGLKNGQK